MKPGRQNPAWWDRLLDRYERRFVRDIAFVMLVLWSFVTAIAISRSTVLGVLAALSLPAGTVAALAIAQRPSAAERAAFQQSLSEDPSTAQRGDPSWCQLDRDHRTRSASWAARARFPRPSFRTAVIVTVVHTTVAIAVAIIFGS